MKAYGLSCRFQGRYFGPEAQSERGVQAWGRTVHGIIVHRLHVNGSVNSVPSLAYG